MPFMKGRAAFRRTLDYLNKGEIVFKDNVRIMSVNYVAPHSKYNKESEGLRNFVFWNLAQVQYKNPSVQIVTFKNLAPTPFIRCYLDSGEQVLIDCDSKSAESIIDHVKKVVGKTEQKLAEEALAMEKKENPANFGYNAPRWCICEVPGQVPCPGWEPLPKERTGKFNYQKVDRDNR